MFLPPPCNHLADNVNSILDLVQESNIEKQGVRVVAASLAKAIAPKFEIVFAGAFSAGKSMLINALIDFFKNKQRWENEKVEVTSTNHGSELLQPNSTSGKCSPC